MKKDERQSREFNATMLIAIVVSAILSLALLAMIYGCLRANQHAPKTHVSTTDASGHSSFILTSLRKNLKTFD
ncbi:MAG TPA: hypothetical protein VKZ53_03095 [Candidatus Angelobacter sp.]|nr:hypothetical protein [Candidatus Angelobacter sp.]